MRHTTNFILISHETSMKLPVTHIIPQSSMHMLDINTHAFTIRSSSSWTFEFHNTIESHKSVESTVKKTVFPFKYHQKMFFGSYIKLPHSTFRLQLIFIFSVKHTKQQNRREDKVELIFTRQSTRN